LQISRKFFSAVVKERQTFSDAFLTRNDPSCVVLAAQD
jgi:hypothetical protein